MSSEYLQEIWKLVILFFTHPETNSYAQFFVGLCCGIIASGVFKQLIHPSDWAHKQFMYSFLCFALGVSVAIPVAYLVSLLPA